MQHLRGCVPPPAAGAGRPNARAGGFHRAIQCVCFFATGLKRHDAAFSAPKAAASAPAATSAPGTSAADQQIMVRQCMEMGFDEATARNTLDPEATGWLNKLFQ